MFIEPELQTIPRALEERNDLDYSSPEMLRSSGAPVRDSSFWSINIRLLRGRRVILLRRERC